MAASRSLRPSSWLAYGGVHRQERYLRPGRSTLGLPAAGWPGAGIRMQVRHRPDACRHGRPAPRVGSHPRQAADRCAGVAAGPRRVPEHRCHPPDTTFDWSRGSCRWSGTCGSPPVPAATNGSRAPSTRRTVMACTLTVTTDTVRPRHIVDLPRATTPAHGRRTHEVPARSGSHTGSRDRAPLRWRRPRRRAPRG